MDYKEDQEKKRLESIMRSPISIRLQKAKEKLTTAVLGIQNEYELPSYIMDFVITSVLNDVKEIEMKMIIEDLNKIEHEVQRPASEENQNGDR